MQPSIIETVSIISDCMSVLVLETIKAKLQYT